MGRIVIRKDELESLRVAHEREKKSSTELFFSLALATVMMFGVTGTAAATSATANTGSENIHTGFTAAVTSATADTGSKHALTELTTAATSTTVDSDGEYVFTGFTATAGKDTHTGNSSQSYPSLVDGKFEGSSATKWCTKSNDSNPYIEFHSDYPIAPTGYILTTGDGSSPNAPDYEAVNLSSPNSTLGGDLLKKWKIVDGERVLLKAGVGFVNQEPYNETLGNSVAFTTNPSLALRQHAGLKRSDWVEA